MKTISYSLGFWASATSAFLFLLFTFCFIAIALNNPDAVPDEWTSLTEYTSRNEGGSQNLTYLAQLSMLIFCPLFIVILNSIHTIALPEHKILSRIGLSFGLVFSVLASMLYFVQLTTARYGLEKGYTEGIEPFLQFYPYSAILSIGMLGMTLFLGLSSLFIAPLFHRNRLERIIRVFFFINGMSCLIGALGYGFDQKIVIHLSMNVGMGGALTVLSIALSVFFKRAVKWE